MKIFFGFLLLVACVLISYILSDKYRKRKLFYLKFEFFNKKLMNELTFSKKSIIELIAELDCENDFNNYLFNYVKNNITVGKINYISSDERDFFINYLDSIGTGDAKSQLNFLTNANIEIKKNLNESVENEKKYKTLYLKIGFLIGLILLIVAM